MFRTITIEKLHNLIELTNIRSFFALVVKTDHVVSVVAMVTVVRALPVVVAVTILQVVLAVVTDLAVVMVFLALPLLLGNAELLGFL